MERVGQGIDRAIIFGASGGIGAGLVAELIARGAGTVFAASRSRPENLPDGAQWVRFDLDDEETIAAAAETVGAPVDCAIAASGLLTLPDGTGPERSYKQIDADAMARVFHLNTIGPALVAKHFLPLLPRDRRSLFAALSARVGSIGDNALGGWHGYRASKAAANQIVRGASIEIARSHPRAAVVALHPGTVETRFTADYPGHRKVPAETAARNLLDVIEGLGAADTGRFLDWAGKEIPW